MQNKFFRQKLLISGVIICVFSLQSTLQAVTTNVTNECDTCKTTYDTCEKKCPGSFENGSFKCMMTCWKAFEACEKASCQENAAKKRWDH